MATQPASENQEEKYEPVLQKENEWLKVTLLAPADRMKVFLQYELKTKPPEGKFTRVELLQFFPKFIPANLLHPEVLDDIASHIQKGDAQTEPRRIAKGVLPVPGRDGKLLLLVKAVDSKQKSSEVVDPWYLKNFDNIEVGMPVARVYPPHPGENGITALGTPVPFEPGKDYAVDLDESLCREQAPAGRGYENLIAKITGYLRVEAKNKLKVAHELVITGNVDFQTGDIQFVGKVLVRGNVNKDFRVQARGDICIEGSVLGGRLSSSEGNIIVKGSIIGDQNQPIMVSDFGSMNQLKRSTAPQKSQIFTAIGTVQAKVVEGASIEASGDIEIAKEILSSKVRTKAILRTPQGHIIGGEIHAVCGVDAHTIGTAAGTTTKIFLSSDIESTAEFSQIVDQLRSHDSAREMLRLYLGPYADNPARIKLMHSEHRQKMENLLSKLKEVEASRARIIIDRDELLKTARHNKVYRINLQSLAYVGTEIVVGTEKYAPTENITGKKTIEYLPETNQFAVTELKPLECTLE